MDLADYLLPQPPEDRGSWRWATVTAVDPLRVRLDGDTTALDLTPDALVSGLAVDDRVWCQIHGQRVIIHGLDSDTGWETLSVASGWTATSTVRVRRIGAVVYWVGRVTPDNPVAGTQTVIDDGGVPTWARPASIFNTIRPLASNHTSSSAETAFKNAAVTAAGGVTAWYGQSNSDPLVLSGLSGYIAG